MFPFQEFPHISINYIHEMADVAQLCRDHLQLVYSFDEHDEGSVSSSFPFELDKVRVKGKAAEFEISEIATSKLQRVISANVSYISFPGFRLSLTVYDFYYMGSYCKLSINTKRRSVQISERPLREIWVEISLKHEKMKPLFRRFVLMLVENYELRFLHACPMLSARNLPKF